MAKPKMSKATIKNNKCYFGIGECAEVGNALHGKIDPRVYIQYKDFMQMPDDRDAFANCSPKAFDVEVFYEDDKRLDN